MTRGDESNPPASSPCSMAEHAEQLLPRPRSRVAHTSDWPEVRAFRRAERERLLAGRLATALRERQRRAEAIDARLIAEVDLAPYRVLAIYWPIKGEPDLRAAAQRHLLAGGLIALPVVIAKGEPLEFWRWQPGAPTTPGLWNIPQPLERDVLTPDALLVPLVGFDAAGYRLGYGGGYYDRTLASFARKPLSIGVGDAAAEIASIRPEPHDVPMDMIVTDREVRYDAGRGVSCIMGRTFGASHVAPANGVATGMSQESLRQHLEALRRELKANPRLDGETRAQLGGVADEIRTVLDAKRPDYEPLRERVADATLRFEAEHPRFAQVLSDITDTLAKLGI